MEARLPSLSDLALAVVAVALDVVLFTQLSEAPDQKGWASRAIPPAVIVGAGLVTIVPLWFRRRAPMAVCLILVGHAALVTLALGSRPLVSLLLALYTMAVWSHRGRALLGLGVTLAAHAVAVGYEASFTGSGLTAFAVVVVAAVYLLLDVTTWAAGRWGASATARAQLRRLEASRAALAAEAVDAERLRIARELHDIVAHAVTVMVLQSAGARRVVGKDPALAAEAMRAVEISGKQAIAELRRLLEVLRAGDPESGEPASAAIETSRVAEVDQLAAQVRSTGIEVRLETRGTVRELDPSVDLTAYRVVQESLTNVNKHAGAGSTAVVTLEWLPDALTITIEDDGAHTPATGQTASGYGLVGLAERVKLAGGLLEVGSRLDRVGYRVRAVLPTSVPAASTTQPLASV